MHVVITSNNPVKKRAVFEAFTLIFPNEKINIKEAAVESGVSAQPMDSAETLLGAKQRVENGTRVVPEADYWVGIEGGVESVKKTMECIAWVYIKSREGRVGKGRAGTFELPQKITTLVEQGMELGEANDAVFAMKNSKHNLGIIGCLSNNAIDRTEYYRQAVVFAMLPFINPELY